MSTSATIAIALFLCIIVTTAYISILRQIRLTKHRSKIQKQEKRLALLLHPSYQAKIAADRTYRLAVKKLALKRERQTVELKILQAESAIKQYTSLQRVPSETYLLNSYGLESFGDGRRGVEDALRYIFSLFPAGEEHTRSLPERRGSY